ncbi:MAG: MgtC/SapB family protein [Spirochaetia bacterium]|jgi:putative Mg2+ transporter-C (MgtC) family protein|nr:MgtC/SapB family protein [Spirochaetia bacterium]
MIFENLRDFTLYSAAIRLVSAMVCGGMIGVEREFKKRPAGFRTHMLICIGSALTTLTSQYIYVYLKLFTDLARLGAQVVAGMGFIGAGTIIITRKNNVKGLTTAAGLWTTAIIGLCLGAGYFEGGFLGTAIVLFAELVLSKIEYRRFKAYRETILYVETDRKGILKQVVEKLEQNGTKVVDIQMNGKNKKHVTRTFLTIRQSRTDEVAKLEQCIRGIEGVLFAETLSDN